MSYFRQTLFDFNLLTKKCLIIIFCREKKVIMTGFEINFAS